MLAYVVYLRSVLDSTASTSKEISRRFTMTKANGIESIKVNSSSKISGIAEIIERIVLKSARQNDGKVKVKSN